MGLIVTPRPRKDGFVPLTRAEGLAYGLGSLFASLGVTADITAIAAWAARDLTMMYNLQTCPYPHPVAATDIVQSIVSPNLSAVTMSVTPSLANVISTAKDLSCSGWVPQDYILYSNGAALVTALAVVIPAAAIALHVVHNGLIQGWFFQPGSVNPYSDDYVGNRPNSAEGKKPSRLLAGIVP